MPIIKQQSKFVDQKVNFICDPFLEMICSMHVLTDSKHHEGCCKWVEYATKNMDSSLLLRITELGNRYAQYAFLLDLADVTSSSSNFNKHNIEDIMLHFKEVSLPFFSSIFLGLSLIDSKKIDIWLKDKFVPKDELGEILNYLAYEDICRFLENAQNERENINQLLADYWNGFFQTEWMRLKPFYEATLGEEKSKFTSSKSFDYILNLHSDLELENSTLIMKKSHVYSCSTQLITDINIYISFFTIPHLMLYLFENTVSLYFNAALPIEDYMNLNWLVSGTKAISDLTRISILKTLTEGEMTTKELAKRFKLTNASISQHLRILKEANFIQFRKDKNHVYYSDNQIQLRKYLSELNGFLLNN